MDGLTQQQFTQLLLGAAHLSIDLAQIQVSDPLPQEVCWELSAYGLAGKESSMDEIVAMLYRDGSFPAVVDVAVKGVHDTCTVIGLVPSGHGFVNDIGATWNTPTGMGPFKSIGLMLPYPIWQRQRPLTLIDLREAVSKWPIE